ncbi:MAG TPA: hypothetical protein VF815_40400 [Myxococcaceae bacterium]|jgi:hypothetical protein
MRKVTWTTVGLVVLSMMLCGSGELLAQTGTATSPADPGERDATDTRVRGTAPGDARVGPEVGTGAVAEGTGGSGRTGGGTGGGTDASSAELRRTVLQLQADMAQMSQELAQVRAQLADLGAAVGVGGSGRAGQQGATQGTAARGNTGDRGTDDRSTVGSGSMPDRNPRDPGAAVVNAIYTGTVSAVSAGQLVLLDEEGQRFTVALGDRTRVLRDGKRITAGQLEKGTRVRATVDLLAGNSQALEVVTLPSAQ